VIVLDASYLIAYRNPDDRHHSQAVTLLESVANQDWIVHSATLAEVLVGAVKVNRGQQLLADLQSLGLVLAPRDPNEALRLAELRVATGLKLPDCFVLHLAIWYQASILSFDHALGRAAQNYKINVIAG
jgi:predicted nucleic acid-binding protein